mmetsp:Transcript_4597/g.6994  ORF Transcript_4597/g.6994 Transcript_4597/m.6994 type:complete len:93 (+) Transcript_4597:595-873(+)
MIGMEKTNIWFVLHGIGIGGDTCLVSFLLFASQAMRTERYGYGPRYIYKVLSTILKQKQKKQPENKMFDRVGLRSEHIPKTHASADMDSIEE